MEKAKKPKNVKLMIGMLAKNKNLFKWAEGSFIKEFGEIDYESPLISFNYTDYYKKEIGHPLKRKFISFKRLIPPGRIAKIKVTTNLIEKKSSNKKNGSLQRNINIDPGYISDAKLILATTKDYCHRIYLDKGIYAEVTLSWKKDSFEPLEWTYPDYRTSEYIAVLNKIRTSYMERRS